MQQLSGADAVSLYGEHGNTFNHVAALCIYDPSPRRSGKVRFKEILAHFAAHLGDNPLFRRRLVQVPFSVDRPYWVEDAEVDVEFHVRHIALPEPGDWRQLMIQVARLHARPLDRSRPLWEIYVIEGLRRVPGVPPGGFALFCKFHHASVDGMAVVHLLGQLHDDRPDAPVPLLEAVSPKDQPYSGAGLLGRAAVHSLGRGLSVTRLSLATTWRVARQVGDKGLIDTLERLRGLVRRVPRTRFSDKVSAHRVVEGIGLPMAGLKAVRKAVPGATINDIFLALAGGALRRYLGGKGELPERSLAALMPISLRGDASAGGNQVTAVPVALRSDIADPVERLQAVHQASLQARDDADLLGADLLKQIMDTAPLPAVELLINRLVIPQLNTAVSNVRGPDGPLYLAGAELLRIYPVSIPSDHVGLNHTAISFGDYFWVGIVSCRQMLPDPAEYGAGLRAEFVDLLRALELQVPSDPAFTNAGSARRATRNRC